MSTQTIATAQHEYYRRPADERYQTLPDMITAAQADKTLSREVAYNWRDLCWMPGATDTATDTAGMAGTDEQGLATDSRGLLLQSPKGTATLTHWAFGQACTMLQSPAAFLRDRVTPDIAAAVLNHRITSPPSGSTALPVPTAPTPSPMPVPVSRRPADLWQGF